MKTMKSGNFPIMGNEAAKKKALAPGAREPKSTVSIENSMTASTSKHPTFGTLGHRHQQE